MLLHHRLWLLAFPMRTKAVCRRWPNVGSPRFRRDPFVRDGVFDLGGASAPRIAGPHMLPSATLKASASAILLLSRLNRPSCTIAVYASPWSSPPTTQHSLPGGRYPLPGPDIHRLDLASFLAHSCLSSIVAGHAPNQSSDHHASALGRADMAACQRFTLAIPSGMASRAGFKKSTVTCAVMSATE